MPENPYLRYSTFDIGAARNHVTTEEISTAPHLQCGLADLAHNEIEEKAMQLYKCELQTRGAGLLPAILFPPAGNGDTAQQSTRPAIAAPQETPENRLSPVAMPCTLPPDNLPNPAIPVYPGSRPLQTPATLPPLVGNLLQAIVILSPSLPGVWRRLEGCPKR